MRLLISNERFVNKLMLVAKRTLNNKDGRCEVRFHNCSFSHHGSLLAMVGG